MFKGVALAHGLHLKHSSVLTPRGKLTRAPCSALCDRWHSVPAVAQSKRPSSKEETKQGTAHPSSERHMQSSNDHPMPERNATPIPELVFAVDTLLSRSRNAKRALEHIRASPSLYAALSDRENVRKIAEALAGTRAPIRSFRVLNLAFELGCRLKQNAYECVSHHLASAREWHAVLSVVSLGKRHTGRTTGRLLNWRARAFAETQQYALLPGVLKEFRENNIQPTRRTFHLILSGHIRNRDLKMAKQCIQAMEEAGLPVDASTHAIVATNYRSLGADLQVQTRSLEALPGVKSTTATAIVNSLMQMCIDAHDLPGAIQLLSLFNRRHVDALLKVITVGNDGAMKREGAMPMPMDALTSVHGNLIPNAATFSVFINYLATQSDLPGTIQILQSMTMTGVKPTPGLVSSVLHVLFNTGRGDLAVRMVSGMCDTVQVPLAMFKPLLSPSCAWDEALPFVPSSVLPTIRVFNALLKGVLRIYGLNSASVILRIIRAIHLKPNAATLEIMIAHLGKDKRAHLPVLFRLLRNLSSPALRPTLRQLHVILSRVLRHEKYLLYGRGWNSTAALFSSRHIKPQRPFPENRISGVADSFHPIAGIDLPSGLTLRRTASSLLQSLSARKIMSDMVTVGLRIQHDAMVKCDVESAREIFNVLLTRGMHPNEYHFSALMEGFAYSGDIEGAVEIMKSAKQAGVVPNVVMFTILIVGHGRQGNPDQAIRVFEEMVLAGIKPDVPAIDAISGAFFAVGAYSMAARVLKSLWPHIQPFPKELRGAPLKDLAHKYGEAGKNDTSLEVETLAGGLESSWRANELETTSIKKCETEKFDALTQDVRDELLSTGQASHGHSTDCALAVAHSCMPLDVQKLSSGARDKVRRNDEPWVWKTV